MLTYSFKAPVLFARKPNHMTSALEFASEETSHLASPQKDQKIEHACAEVFDLLNKLNGKYTVDLTQAQNPANIIIHSLRV